jgi:hypothetical protein
MGHPNDHGKHGGKVRYRFFVDEKIAKARLIFYDS